MNDACELEVGTWGQYDHYACDRCRTATTNYDTAVARCQVARADQPLASDVGLLGPDGEPLPRPGDQEDESPSDDVLSHDMY